MNRVSDSDSEEDRLAEYVLVEGVVVLDDGGAEGDADALGELVLPGQEPQELHFPHLEDLAVANGFLSEFLS